MKKLLSLVLALALVLTSMTAAFASSTAPAADIADDDVKTAVERLAALGIVAGKADGKYHENDPLTRDEFAKILVVSLGLDNVAKASMGSTKFSDVGATVWSSGYVNVAASKGLIKGRPDGTFGRLDPVSPAEAVTMLVRALGYKDEWLEGTWPANMIEKADNIGMTTGLDITGAQANRGLAAQLVNNTLELPMVIQTGFGSNATYEVDDTKSILGDKLTAEAIEGQVVETSDVDSDLDADVVVIDGTEYTLVQEEYTPADLLGKNIEGLVNDDDEIILVSSVEGDDVAGTIEVEGTTVTVGDDEYSTTDDTVVYVNKVAEGTLATDMYGTLVVNGDDEIIAAYVYEWDDADGYVVTEYDVEDEEAPVLKAEDSAGAAANTTFDFDEEDDDSTVVVMGDASALDEIEANDVVYVATEGTNFYIQVVKDSVAGTLSKVASSGANVTIAGEKYDTDITTVSVDGNETIVAYSNGAVTDLIGEEVTAIFGMDGSLRHIFVEAAEEEESNVKYGLVTSKLQPVDLSTGEQYNAIKIFVAEEDSIVTYTVNDDATNYDDVAADDVIAYTLNDDGEVDAIDVLTDGADTSLLEEDITASALTVEAFNSTYNYMDAAANYYVNSDTVLVENYSDDAPATIAWADIESIDIESDISVIAVIGENSTIVYAVVMDEPDPSGSDVAFAVVSDIYFDGDDDRLVLTSSDGEETDAATSVTEGVYVNDFVAYTVDDGDVTFETAVYYDGTVGDVDGYTIEEITVEDINGYVIFTEGGDKFISEDTIVYTLNTEDEEMTVSSADDIEADATVILVTEDGEDVAAYVVIVE